MTVKKLSEMRPNESGTIVDTHGSGWVRKRLLDMGVTKSAPVIFRKSAPLGDPVQINLRGYELSLRKSEAELVDVEVLFSAPTDGAAARKRERFEEKEAKRKAREEAKEAKRKAREERKEGRK